MMETILHILSKGRGENPRWTRHDDDQIRSPMSCMLFPVIVRGGADGRRADRGHAALDGRPASRCTAAPRYAGIR